MSKRYTLLWLLLFAVASLLGFFEALGSYASAYQGGVHYLGWKMALSWDLTKWNLWALLAPPIMWLGRVFPVNYNNHLRRAPAYALVTVGIALAHFLLHNLLHSLIVYGADGFTAFFSNFSPFLAERYYVFISDFVVGILICGLILTGGNAHDYYRQVQTGETRAAQLEAQLAQAQLQALKMQLQPHFLFNALHSVSANLRDPKVARTMLARIGDFLRLTLDNAGAQEITLKQELDFLRCYLEIEQTRFRDRLTVEMDVEPETWDAAIPNLILQPLIENAVKHGIAPHAAPGRIDVRARRLNSNLQVQIQDNGRGINTEKSETFSLESANDNGRTGIGLKTTRARLERLYPDSHQFKIGNSPEGGLIATLEIPFKTTTKSEAAIGNF